MGYDWNALPNELRSRANEAYEATGIDLSILHKVAYRLEARQKHIEELEARLDLFSQPVRSLFSAFGEWPPRG